MFDCQNKHHLKTNNFKIWWVCLKYVCINYCSLFKKSCSWVKSLITLNFFLTGFETEGENILKGILDSYLSWWAISMSKIKKPTTCREEYLTLWFSWLLFLLELLSLIVYFFDFTAHCSLFWFYVWIVASVVKQLWCLKYKRTTRMIKGI